METYTETQFGKWETEDKAGTLRASGGSYGGGSEVIVLMVQIDGEDGIQPNQPKREIQGR